MVGQNEKGAASSWRLGSGFRSNSCVFWCETFFAEPHRSATGPGVRYIEGDLWPVFYHVSLPVNSGYACCSRCSGQIRYWRYCVAASVRRQSRYSLLYTLLGVWRREALNITSTLCCRWSAHRSHWLVNCTRNISRPLSPQITAMNPIWDLHSFPSVAQKSVHTRRMVRVNRDRGALCIRLVNLAKARWERHVDKSFGLSRK